MRPRACIDKCAARDQATQVIARAVVDRGRRIEVARSCIGTTQNQAAYEVTRAVIQGGGRVIVAGNLNGTTRHICLSHSKLRKQNEQSGEE